ncbi:MAG: type II toxin-antitoxin system HicA family toxin [Chloroflexi bacterium]|nr:type II toxin-antitoxin system HicA family toxin [Chloroflexota bacterium]
MAGRLPAVRPRQIVRALEKAGFVIEHQTGSHVIMRHPSSRRKVAVPRHNRDVRRGLMFAIIQQAGLSAEEFSELL